MYFDENNEWVDQITKPQNSDYNVAEKTTLTFPIPHGFIVGDFLTETGGATGVVYNLIDTLNIEVARYNEIQFPATGTVDNGSASPQSYTESIIEHGIDNLVLQELVDRTNWLKNEAQRLTNRDVVIENRVDDLRQWLTVSTNQTLFIDRKYLVDITAGNVVLTLPGSPLPGRFLTVSHYAGDLSVNSLKIAGGQNNIESSTDQVSIDIPNQPFRCIFVGGSVGWKILGD